MQVQKTFGVATPATVSFATASAERKQESYFDIFVDYKIPLWKRIVGGAALPIAGPLFLLAGCTSSKLTPIPREKPSPDDYVELSPDEPQDETVPNNEEVVENNTTPSTDPVDDNEEEPLSDDDVAIDDDTDVADSDDTAEETPDDVIDDDTDGGTSDEVIYNDCEPGEYLPCGPCDLGIMACTPEHLWSECEGLPEETIASCYNGPDGTENIGACRDGFQRCVYDSGNEEWGWSSCEHEIQPSAEICDGRDNDCNGRIDDETTDCGECGCVAGHCAVPTCGPNSCGTSDGCGDICQNCTDGYYCAEDTHCEPIPLLCRVTDSFEYGNDFSSHNYIQSTGVDAGDDSSVHSCGPAQGVYFETNGDWVQVSLAVDPRSESVRVYTRSHNAFSIIRLDGFDCHNPLVGSFCYASDSCSLTTSIWNADRFSSPRFADGQVDIIITGAGVRDGFFGPSPDDEHPDIATVEIESCVRAIP